MTYNPYEIRLNENDVPKELRQESASHFPHLMPLTLYPCVDSRDSAPLIHLLSGELFETLIVPKDKL